MYSLNNQKEILIEKAKELEALTKDHEKLKCCHETLVNRYEKLSIEHCVTNSLSHVAQIENKNEVLRTRLKGSLATMGYYKKIMMSSCAHMRSLSTLISC